jgi:hypothetical protein
VDHHSATATTLLSALEDIVKHHALAILILGCAAPALSQGVQKGATPGWSPSQSYAGNSWNVHSQRILSDDAKTLKALGFFQVGDTWLYQTSGMAKPVLVQSLPVFGKYKDKNGYTQYGIIKPAVLSSRQPKLPNSYKVK